MTYHLCHTALQATFPLPPCNRKGLWPQKTIKQEARTKVYPKAKEGYVVPYCI